MRYLYAILALGLLVALHELGHLLAARAFGIRVKRFSFGFGPPIFTLRTKRTEWRLGAFPLGGNVQIHGTNPHEEGLFEDPQSFLAKRWWKRVLVLSSGSVLNFAVALGVLWALYFFGTHVPVAMTIGIVEPGSEAAHAQLRPGDVVEAVNGETYSAWGAFVTTVAESPGRKLRLTLRRDDVQTTVEVTPTADERGAGRLGVTQQYVFRRHRAGEALSLALGYLGRLFVEGGELLWRQVRGRPGVDVTGAVMLVKQASDVAAVDWDAFLRVLAHLSVALAVFNLIPLPALDGGRMVFTLVEAARGKRVDPRVETAAQTVGFLVLLALIVGVAAGELRSMGVHWPSHEAPAVNAGDAGTYQPTINP